MRRILDLAGRLPGLTRVDLTTNYRCPPEVVRRAARLVEHVTERFVKRIDAAPRNTGTLVLAADPGDDVARARRLLGAWYGRDTGGYAILARTNGQLAPYAAVALELGIPFRVEQDGLCLDDQAIDSLLEQIARDGREADPLLLRIAAADPAGDPGRVLLGWASAFATLESLTAAVARARRARVELRDGSQHLVLATAHGTKGLEFDHVAVVGMDDGVFPSDRSITEAPDPARALDEERRLAYVAWTRARQELVLVYDPDAPSVFMREAFSAAELRPP